MGTLLRVLSMSFPMNTNIAGFGYCVLWMKVGLALEESRETLSMNGFITISLSLFTCLPGSFIFL